MSWMAYYNVEPWGSKIDGMRMAANTAGVYNAGLMMSNPKKLRQKACKPEDFYIGVDHQQKKKGLTWQQHKAIMDALAKRSNNERR